jgi:hypothetical protein
LSDDPTKTPGTWDADALLTKAQRYAEAMLEVERDDWRFALWSSFALEFLARAALADYNPALLADPKDWNNIYSAVGFTPTAKKFIPKSIGIAEVIERLTAIVPLDSELAGFCLQHTTRRNAELHSGDAAFEGVKHSSWLPLFYKACKVLLADMANDLSILLGDEEAETAEKMIATLADDAAKAVNGTIHAHKVVWEKKEQAERDKLTAQATLWATRQAGHRVKCPACASDALISGDPISVPQKAIKGDVITESQEHLPSKFECIACGMKIAGLSQLNAAGLGDLYKQTLSYDAAEYYAPQDDMHDYEPDNNEPMG